MKFEFYTDALENTPKLSVDGIVPNSIHFSHWADNETPDELKADTSTEIALNLVASADRDSFTKGIDLVTYARGDLFVIGIPSDGGWFYRMDYPYYSWAETVVRPRIARRDLTRTLETLNAGETSGHGQWKTDNREMTSAVKFLDESGSLTPSSWQPDDVAKALRASVPLKTSSVG